MHSKEVVSLARYYERAEDAAPGEAMLNVLIDLFTGGPFDRDQEDDGCAAESLVPGAVWGAWERLSRDLSVPEWLLESQDLADGVDVLAANLTEAGRPDLAAELHELREPRFEGASRSVDVSPESLRPVDEGCGVVDDGRLWAPGGGRLTLGLRR